MTLTMENGATYECVRDFHNGRAIVNMDGAYVFVDRTSQGSWELSGEPARPGLELLTLDALVKALEEQGTVVTVTKPGDP